jgi:hypothetical protein
LSSYVRSCFQKRIDPQEDILITHHAAHALHSRRALSLAHAEGCQNRVSYLLDDSTDEDAFRALEQRGIGILVSEQSPPTRGDVFIEGPRGRRALPARARRDTDVTQTILSDLFSAEGAISASAWGLRPRD